MLSEFLHVRGTLASDESRLTKLLSRHIGVWNVMMCRMVGVVFLPQSDNGLDPRRELGYDEALMSYKDGGLWNELFKTIHNYLDRRAIVLRVIAVHFIVHRHKMHSNCARPCSEGRFTSHRPRGQSPSCKSPIRPCRVRRDCFNAVVFVLGR